MRGLLKRLTRLSGLAGLLSPSSRTYRGLLRSANAFHDVDLDWVPGGERVMVLAPHMDDETLGCGGAVALHRRAGASITVVFLTDGRHGSSELRGLTGEALREAERRLVAVRKLEAAAALATLGVEDAVFLDAVDGGLAEDASISGRLATELARTLPQIVYLPSFLEQHPDHRATTEVLLAATADCGLEFMVHAYEVWTPQHPNCIVSIDSVVDLKRAALAHYRSQLVEADFEHGILGLNAYRAMMRPRPGRRYAEAFCALPVQEYAAAWHRFRDG